MKTKVRELRISRGLTQQQLAELVHVSNRTVISIEKEQYSPSLMLAYRMAQVFGTTVEDLCCLKENKEMEDLEYENKEKAWICCRYYNFFTGYGKYHLLCYFKRTEIFYLIHTPDRILINEFE